jgi:hypothetical protein
MFGCCTAVDDDTAATVINPASEAISAPPPPQEVLKPVSVALPKGQKPGKACTTRMPQPGDIVMCMGGKKVGHDSAGTPKRWVLDPGNCAEVMEVDSDGDFRLRNDQNIESGFLFRAEFVFIAGADNEEAAPVPEQKMRASLVDKSEVGVVPIEQEVKAEPAPVLAPPAAPTPSEAWFEVLLERKDPQEKAGLHLDPVDDNAFEVINLGDGMVKSYNSTAPANKQITPGHFVVGINDKPPKEMLTELSTSSQIKLKIAPRMVFTVQLTKPGTGTLGMNLTYRDGCSSMLFMGCAPGSVVDTHNKSASNDQQVVAGDRITEVNGIAGDPTKMLEAMKGASTLSLKLARPMR